MPDIKALLKEELETRGENVRIRLVAIITQKARETDNRLTVKDVNSALDELMTEGVVDIGSNPKSVVLVDNTTTVLGDIRNDSLDSESIKETTTMQAIDPDMRRPAPDINTVETQPLQVEESPQGSKKEKEASMESDDKKTNAEMLLVAIKIVTDLQKQFVEIKAEQAAMFEQIAVLLELPDKVVEMSNKSGELREQVGALSENCSSLANEVARLRRELQDAEKNKEEPSEFENELMAAFAAMVNTTGDNSHTTRPALNS